MFVYEKKLQYPVRIARPDPKMAARIISQYGGPDGELGASLRYLSQRFAMPCGELKGLLTDGGVEELGHLEIVGAMIYQLTRNLSCDDITKAGFDVYFVDHGAGVFPVSAAGMPYQAAAMQSKGDPVTDLHENLAAEQKARTTYENLLLQADDPDVIDVLRYLRQREIVHYQRFAEGLEMVKDQLNEKNFYAFNMSLDLAEKGNCAACS
jgi:spore coat protein JC